MIDAADQRNIWQETARLLATLRKATVKASQNLLLPEAKTCVLISYAILDF